MRLKYFSLTFNALFLSWGKGNVDDGETREEVERIETLTPTLSEQARLYTFFKFFRTYEYLFLTELQCKGRRKRSYHSAILFFVIKRKKYNDIFFQRDSNPKCFSL